LTFPTNTTTIPPSALAPDFAEAPLSRVGRCIAIALCVGSAVSCGDLISASEKVNVILPSAEQLAEIIRGVDDATSRVGAGLGSGPRAAQLREQLEKLHGSLNSADAIAVDAAVGAAREAYNAFAGSSEFTTALGPDLSAIDIALLLTESSIQKPCAQPTVAGVQSSFASCTGR
jgi:hypothetical protein